MHCYSKYINFTVPIKKEVTRIDNNGEEITKHISYILQLRVMASSLSNLLHNFSEGIHRIKLDTMIKNVKYVELNISFAIAFLNIQILKMI